MHQKVTTILAGIAIAILLAIIIVVWVQVGHGAFRPKHRHHNNTSLTDENLQQDEFLPTTKSSFASYQGKSS